MVKYSEVNTPIEVVAKKARRRNGDGGPQKVCVGRRGWEGAVEAYHKSAWRQVNCKEGRKGSESREESARATHRVQRADLLWGARCA